MTPTLNPAPCAAEKPVIDVVHVDGHFVIADDDMGKLTGYIAALEAGCTAPNRVLNENLYCWPDDRAREL